MKKTILALAALIFTCSSFAQKNNPTVHSVQSAVLHAGNLEPIKDVRNFLLTLYNNESFSTDFANQWVDSAKKEGRVMTATYRRNMIEFKTIVDSTLRVTSQLWLIPQQGEGLLTNLYFYKNRLINTDPWLFPFRSTTVTLSAPDSDSSFVYHVKIAAKLMKAGMFVPHPLSARIQYNITNSMYGVRRVIQLNQILEGSGLRVFLDEKQMTASNKYRTYTLKSNRQFEPTFEVSPKW